MNKKAILVSVVSIFLVVGIVKASIEIRDGDGNLVSCNKDDIVRDLAAELGRRGISNDSDVYKQQMKQALGDCYDQYFGEVQGSTDEPTPTPEATVEPTTQPPPKKITQTPPPHLQIVIVLTFLV